MQHRIINIILLAVLVMSCNTSPNYYTVVHGTEDGIWQSQEPFNCTIDIRDSSAYNAFLLVRSTDIYKFTSLWCLIRFSDNNGVIERDTINIPISEINGKMLGDGLSVKTHKVKINKRPLNLHSGNCYIHIEHKMDESELEGISDVGIIVKQAWQSTN